MRNPDDPLDYPSLRDLIAAAQLASRIGEDHDVDSALVGGVALQLYGSPRFTRDADLVAGAALGDPSPMLKRNILSFGGVAYDTPIGVGVDWITRSDEYAQLYDAVLDASVSTKHGIKIARPEYLVAMKMAASRPKDYEDLMWLLGAPGLVDVTKAREIVRAFLGGRYAVDQFNASLEEAKWRAGKT